MTNALRRLSETYYFRPIAEPPDGRPLVVPPDSPTRTAHNWLRYADGLWLPDDGQPDLAFVDLNFPWILSVQLSTYPGIEWEWRDTKLTCSLLGLDYLPSGMSGWHHQVYDVAEGWGRSIDHHAFSQHPNQRAARAASDKCCDLHHCGNGRGPRFQPDDPYILAGALRTATGVIKPPADLHCFRCADDGYGHKLQFLDAERDTLQDRKDAAEEQLRRAESRHFDAQDELHRATRRLYEFAAFARGTP